METDAAYNLIKICLTEAIIVTAPIVLTALSIGVIVSILQTVTSIQDQTLTFVPKMLGAALCLWLLGPWMLHRLMQLMLLCWQRAGDVLQ